MELGVYCDCGICLPVAEDKTGSALTCSCGRRVVVPLLEEFREQPVLLSSVSVERRVKRLIAEGVLPRTDACLRCGDPKPQVVDANVACERSKTRAYGGGLRLLLIPIPFAGFLFKAWEEETAVEIHGRDTDVPAPVGLCAHCQDELRSPPARWYLFSFLLLVLTSAAVGYVVLWAGMVMAAAGLALLVLARHLAWKTWQQKLKRMLNKIPVYRQVMQRYPRAVVMMPHGPRSEEGGPAGSDVSDKG
jgi:hypothetical protein